MSKKKHNVSFTKPEEPNFLKKLKAQCGYKEGPTVDTKRQELPVSDDDDCDPRDDEKPTIVVLKSGDLTEEEFEKALLEKEGKNEDVEVSDEDEEDKEGGKIKFKKPTKRSSDDMSDDHNISTMKKKIKNSEKPSSSMKKIKNKSLLSFDEDEDDD